MINITFDLETLGNTNNAPIVQIAAVMFNGEGDILSKFSRRIDLKSLEQYNFKMDYRTLSWWFNQSSEAIGSVFGEDWERVSLSQALHDFTKWLGKPSEYVYWSHATFDPPILNNNFIQVKKENPIPFRLHRDIRTITHFTGKIEIERKGIAHDALDDCIYQAEYISKGLKQIKKL